MQIENFRAYMKRLAAMAEGVWDSVKKTVNRHLRKTEPPKPLNPGHTVGPTFTRRVRRAIARARLRESQAARIAEVKEANGGDWRAWLMFPPR